MDAVSLINEHLDVTKLLEHYKFDRVNPEGNRVRACCKIHGGSNPSAFVINPENGLWYCHTGDCGAGDAFTLVQKLESLDFYGAVRWLARFVGVDVSSLTITEDKSRYEKELKKWMRMMRKQRKVEVKEFALDAHVQNVTKYRSFKEETLRHFQLGYVESINLRKKDESIYTLHKRLVVPIFFDGKQVGASLRRTRNKDFPKWSHQPLGLETRHLLYNYDNVKHESKIIVSEGITDVWAWFEVGLHAVCTFGDHLTEEQYKLLIKTGADIVLAYDGDDAGRIATRKALELLRYKANVECVSFHEGEDPESITREELMKRYESRTRS